MRRLAASLAAALLLSLFAVTAAFGAADPYQQGDFKGFRNILPPGENGFVNATELAAVRGGGTYPPHANDQLAMYGDLVYARRA